MAQLSEERIAEFKAICEKEGIKYETEAEYREAAHNLVSFVKVLVEISQEQLGWQRRLEKDPKGFTLPSEGRSCSLCHQSIYGDMWYDKWGLKCLSCHEAYKKRIIPGYVFKDSKNDKHITASTLSWKANIHTQTIMKLVRQGKLKARIAPNGPVVFLRKENPNLGKIIEVEKKAIEAKKAAKTGSKHVNIAAE